MAKTLDYGHILPLGRCVVNDIMGNKILARPQWKGELHVKPPVPRIVLGNSDDEGAGSNPYAALRWLAISRYQGKSETIQTSSEIGTSDSGRQRIRRIGAWDLE